MVFSCYHPKFNQNDDKSVDQFFTFKAKIDCTSSIDREQATDSPSQGFGSDLQITRGGYL